MQIPLMQCIDQIRTKRSVLVVCKSSDPKETRKSRGETSSKGRRLKLQVPIDLTIFTYSPHLIKIVFIMGSIVFRNRYWFYKSLYDDYLGRDFKLAFGVSCVLWMPHYWYLSQDEGWGYRSTELLRKAQPTRIISLSTIPEGTGLRIV